MRSAQGTRKSVQTPGDRACALGGRNHRGARRRRPVRPDHCIGSQLGGNRKIAEGGFDVGEYAAELGGLSPALGV